MYDFKMTARLRTNIMKQRPIFIAKTLVFVEKRRRGILA